jgi:hypothetical protein
MRSHALQRRAQHLVVTINTTQSCTDLERTCETDDIINKFVFGDCRISMGTDHGAAVVQDIVYLQLIYSSAVAHDHLSDSSNLRITVFTAGDDNESASVNLDTTVTS